MQRKGKKRKGRRGGGREMLLPGFMENLNLLGLFLYSENHFKMTLHKKLKIWFFLISFYWCVRIRDIYELKTKKYA